MKSIKKYIAITLIAAGISVPVAQADSSTYYLVCFGIGNCYTVTPDQIQSFYQTWGPLAMALGITVFFCSMGACQSQ
jgi:hypothetical protein